MEDSFEAMGRFLLAEGLVPLEELEQALAEAGLKDSAIGKALLAATHIRASELAAFVGADYRVPTISNLEGIGADSDAIRRVPLEIQKRYGLLPLRRAGDILILAAAEMPPEEVLRQLRRASGLRVKLLLAPAEEIRKAVSASPPTAVERPVTRHSTATLPAFRPRPAQLEPVPALAIPREEYDRLSREYGQPLIQRWERIFASGEALTPMRVA